jgi:hypothetical protein
MAINPASVELSTTNNRIFMKAQDEDRIRKQLDLIAQWRASMDNPSPHGEIVQASLLCGWPQAV